MSRSLRNILSELYDEIDDARLIADDIGIELGSINWTHTIETAWREIIDEVEKQRLIEDMALIAIEEYPSRAEEIAEILIKDYNIVLELKDRPKNS